MTGWRSSRLIAGLIIGMFFLVQLSIPVSRLGSDSARRFGWQMYSGAYPPLMFEVTTPEGPVEVDLEDYVVGLRVDVDIVGFLPPHLCEVVVGATRVSWGDGSLEC